MKRIAILCLVTAAWLSVSCSRQAEEKVLSLQYPNAQQRQITLKSGYATTQGMTYTDKDGKVQAAPSYTFYLANYDLDVKENGRHLKAQPKKEDQVKVLINLIGEQGDGPTSLPRSGSYAPRADKFRKVRLMSIETRRGDQAEMFDLSSDQTSGEVRIRKQKNIGGESIIEGEIDVTQGGLAIKGPFFAKVLRPGK